MRNTISIATMLGALLVFTSCTLGGRESFKSDITPGLTDEPAAGFQNIKDGSEEQFIMTVGRRIYFASGSARFDDVALETMNIQIAWLKQHRQWKIKMQGHADDPGNRDKDIKLSERRAKAVMDYFVSQGISQQRMWAKGYGNERLVRNCPELECKALNRRVVVNLRTKFDEAAPQF